MPGLLMFGAVAGAHEEAFFDSGIPAALKVDDLIADHIARAEINAEPVAGVEEKMRGGFATQDRLPGGLGCHINMSESATAERQELGHTVVDAGYIGHSEIPAPDTGLISDEEELESGTAQLEQGFGRAGYKHDLIRIAQVLALLDQGAVAIEEYGSGTGIHGGPLKLDNSSAGVTIAVPTLPTTTPAA